MKNIKLRMYGGGGEREEGRKEGREKEGEKKGERVRGKRV